MFVWALDDGVCCGCLLVVCLAVTFVVVVNCGLCGCLFYYRFYDCVGCLFLFICFGVLFCLVGL